MKPGQPTEARPASSPKKPISPAAERALAEAATRRAERDRAAAQQPHGSHPHEPHAPRPLHPPPSSPSVMATGKSKASPRISERRGGGAIAPSSVIPRVQHDPADDVRVVLQHGVGFGRFAQR